MNGIVIKSRETTESQLLPSKNLFTSGGEYVKCNSKQKKSLLSALIPYVRKSVAPLKKFLAPHKDPQLADELCRVCYSPAQLRYGGVILCHSCEEFFGRNVCKLDKVRSD